MEESMENKPETPNERKLMNKSRSCNTGPSPLKLKTEPSKRKSFNLNEAVRSLDLALGRLKKSKLVTGEDYSTSGMLMPPGSMRRCGTAAEIYMDMSSPSSNINPGIDNASLLSMNFSHYELMRNLSRSTSNSEGAFSGTTCNTCNARNPTDMTLKDEHLEKYFRSAEIWSRRGRCSSPNSVHFEIPEK